MLSGLRPPKQRPWVRDNSPVVLQMEKLFVLSERLVAIHKYQENNAWELFETAAKRLSVSSASSTTSWSAYGLPPVWIGHCRRGRTGYLRAHQSKAVASHTHSRR